MDKKSQVVLFSSTAIALYGYDQGMMSLVNTNYDYLGTMGLKKESPVVGVIVSVYYLAAAVGAVIFSKAADVRGRKMAIYLSLTMTIIGDLLMFLSGLGYLKNVSPIATMFVGRTLLGLGVGGIDAVIPVYSSELSSDDSRGRALAQEFQANILGLNIAYALNLTLTMTLGKYNEWAWRVPIVGMQIFPIALVSVLHQLPESPRWFIFHDRHEEAEESLKTMYSDKDAQKKLKEMQEAAEDESAGNITYAHMLNPKDRSWHPTVVTIMGQVNQAFTGIGAISVYGSQLFVLLGRDTTTAEYLTMGNYVVYLVAMTLAWVLIDKYGRRVLLTSGAGVMAVSFMVLTLFAALAQKFEGASRLTSFAADVAAMSGDVKQMAMSVLGIVTLYFITSVFGITWLATPMLIPTEIFPITARAQGSAISIVIWGLTNFGVTLLTPILFNNISYWLFFIFGLSNLFAGVWTWIYLPETGGRSFEDNQGFFESAWDEKSWVVRKVDKEFLDMPKNGSSDNENDSSNEESPLLRT
ncbi:putative MFS monosaccharide transporter [Taphrina deformans PYCC 5710]|uniref:MFS monosaccharide transporter n=1 Tax=Taphrina deformans (strain PYCC 5710 / ATCC 11124 / CBS 356.35 / IMI 108563 / JCM 9778 / NBRC 8474) TaxID=1097556 RepID=R4XDC7_TAPDE|nr:putative MFS monosaccharide transporter [Taphrina deformans PYCC 5710]|eukprot:CCG81344.1 putative MFS monosaccharide transporter [Taphrina deformans PYCC 5710]